MLFGDDFTADDLQAGERPITVYVCTPIVDAEAVRALARLLIASLLRPLTYDERRTLDKAREELGPALMSRLGQVPLRQARPGLQTYASNLRPLRRLARARRPGPERIDHVFYRATPSPSTPACGCSPPASHSPSLQPEQG